MSVVVDPVGSGLIPSLAHPGSNVTGPSVMAPTWSAQALRVDQRGRPLDGIIRDRRPSARRGWSNSPTSATGTGWTC